jgi:hypothetical protein
MPTTNYAVVANTTSENGEVQIDNKTTTGFRIVTYDSSGTPASRQIAFAVHSSNAIAPPSGVGADAWVNASSSGAISGSYNIASVTKVSTGKYAMVFNTPMPTSGYSVNATAVTGGSRYATVTGKTTTGFTVTVLDSNGADIDSSFNATVHASSTVTPTYTWTRDGTTLKPANDGDDVEIAGQLTASFNQPSGFVSSIVNTSTTGGDGLYLNVKDTSSAIVVQRQSDNQNSVLISGDGSATFAGAVSFGTDKTGSQSVIKVESFDASGNPTNRTVDITRDGTAAFNYSSPGVDVLKVQKAGANQFRVNSNGSIFAQDTTINPISSERRLKENIVPLDASTAWETIKSTPYYTYNFIGDDGIRYGPMADEVPDEMKVATDRTDDVGVIHTFDNGMLQARLYSALQTALTRIEALEAEVQAIKGGN